MATAFVYINLSSKNKYPEWSGVGAQMVQNCVMMGEKAVLNCVTSFMDDL